MPKPGPADQPLRAARLDSAIAAWKIALGPIVALEPELTRGTDGHVVSALKLFVLVKKRELALS
jgi:hypothetical protein